MALPPEAALLGDEHLCCVSFLSPGRFRLMCQTAKDNKAAAKRTALKQVHGELNEIVRRFNAARQVAAQATGLDYKGVRTTTGETDYSYHEPNPLGRQTPDTGIGIFDGQTRANGKDLTPLPRYTS